MLPYRSHYFFFLLLILLIFISIVNLLVSERPLKLDNMMSIPSYQNLVWRDIPEHLLGDQVPKKDPPAAQNNYLINGTDRFLWYQQKRASYEAEDGNNKLWRTFNMTIVKMYLYHAYEFDFDYSISHLTPHLGGTDVYCRYFDENNLEIAGGSVKAISIPEYVVNCPKKVGTKRISVSMTPRGWYDSPVPLIDRTQKALKYKLSLCLSPIYGDEPKWLMFIEMVEHYKLQGVDHFYVYSYKIDRYNNATIQDYVKTGEVEVIELRDNRGREGKDVQDLVYRDCTLRSREESKWSIFADLDERLTMTNYSGTILDFLDNLRVEKFAGITFRQRWILKTEPMPVRYKGDEQVANWMPTRRWHNTTGVGPTWHTTKCIIDPKKVFSMWVHFPMIYFGDYKMLIIDPEQGVVRHYRDVNLGDWGVKFIKEVSEFGKLEMTNYPENLMDQLTKNVQKRVKRIYGS